MSLSEAADLASLEMAFAKDPTSDAFIPLSNAYLEQGRFMEAMVVCKKGIRSQPENVAGRVLLAKVYAGQGKIPKALDEVKKGPRTRRTKCRRAFFARPTSRALGPF